MALLSVSLLRKPRLPSHMRVLACVSDRYQVEPRGWEREARETLGPDSSLSRCDKPSRTWRLPPQPSLPRGGSLSLVTFDGGATCEADRLDPRALVVGGPAEAQGAIRLPDNAQGVEVEIVDGGGSRLLIVLRSEVWRGRSGVIVASWDPVQGSVRVAFDSWSQGLAERDYGCVLVSASAALEPAASAQRFTMEGVALDVVVTRD